MTTQPEEIMDRITEGDRELVNVAGHPVTVNEVHAVLLGFSLAALTALFYAVEPFLAAAAALTVAGTAIGGDPMGQSLSHDKYRYGKHVGIDTIKHEPWWFLTAYAGLLVPSISLGVGVV